VKVSRVTEKLRKKIEKIGNHSTRTRPAVNYTVMVYRLAKCILSSSYFDLKTLHTEQNLQMRKAINHCLWKNTRS